MGAEIFHQLKGALKSAGHNTNVGDEGGFATGAEIGRRRARLHHEGDRSGGYKPGEDVTLALDAASTELYKDGR